MVAFTAITSLRAWVDHNIVARAPSFAAAEVASYTTTDSVAVASFAIRRSAAPQGYQGTPVTATVTEHFTSASSRHVVVSVSVLPCNL